MAEQGDSCQGDQRLNHHEVQHHRPAEPQYRGGVGQHVGREEIERRLLARPQERGQDHRPLVASQHFHDGRLLHSSLCFQFGEHGRFQNSDAYVEPDENQDETEKERNSPAPVEELFVCGPDVHERKRSVGQYHSCRRSELSPACGEAASLWIRPLTREKD